MISARSPVCSQPPSQCRGGRGVVLVIPHEHVAPAREHLAVFGDLDLDAGHRLAHRPRAFHAPLRHTDHACAIRSGRNPRGSPARAREPARDMRAAAPPRRTRASPRARPRACRILASTSLSASLSCNRSSGLAILPEYLASATRAPTLRAQTASFFSAPVPFHLGHHAFHHLFPEARHAEQQRGLHFRQLQGDVFELGAELTVYRCEIPTPTHWSFSAIWQSGRKEKRLPVPLGSSQLFSTRVGRVGQVIVREQRALGVAGRARSVNHERGRLLVDLL